MRARREAALCYRASALTESGRMKIATFNINNINRRLPNLLNWLKTAKPDVVCLQELKCEQAGFPAQVIAKAGYSALERATHLERGRHPVARS